MLFSGFSAEGIDLLLLNQLHNSKDFYEAHKMDIKKLVIEPFYELIACMTETMQRIDPLFSIVPHRMVSRVRRDARYTKDKTLYRANLWLYFRRARAAREDVPFFYMELHPQFWSFGCFGGRGKGEMALAREMMLQEDRLFLDGYQAAARCKQLTLAGQPLKRQRFANAPAAYQPWLNRRELGLEFVERECFAPVLDGSFVASMLHDFECAAPFYRFLLALKERAALQREVGA